MIFFFLTDDEQNCARLAFILLQPDKLLVNSEKPICPFVTTEEKKAVTF